jgi:hypothetical protein
MAGLYLDGLNDLALSAIDYKAEVSSEYFVAKRDIWLRITIFVHTALTMIRMLTSQFLRGTGNLAAGIAHLDGERIVMGLNDYLSLLIQAVVLPVLGITIFVWPITGFKLLIKLRDWADTERQTNDIIYKHEPNKKETFHDMRQGFSDGMMGIFGGISAFFQMVTLTLEKLLTLNPSEAWNTLLIKGDLIVEAPKEGVTNCCKKGHSSVIYNAHRIALESFNPSLLAN